MLTLLLAAAALGAAGPGEPSPSAERYAHVGQGDHWHWVQLHVEVPAVLEARGEVQPRGARTTAGGLWLLDDEGAVLQRTVRAAWSPQALEVYVHGPLAQPMAQGAHPGAPSLGLRLAAVLEPGHYTLLAVFAGEAGAAAGIEGEVRLASDAAVVVGAHRTGTDARVLREHGFDADLHVAAAAPIVGGPAQAAVLQRGSAAATAGHSLFGAFAGHAEGLLRMSLVMPEGVQDGQTRYALDNAGPGAFQFLLHDFVHAAAPGLSAPEAAPGGVWLLVADVALP